MRSTTLYYTLICDYTDNEKRIIANRHKMQATVLEKEKGPRSATSRLQEGLSHIYTGQRIYKWRDQACPIMPFEEAVFLTLDELLPEPAIRIYISSIRCPQSFAFSVFTSSSKALMRLSRTSKVGLSTNLNWPAARLSMISSLPPPMEMFLH